MKKHEKHPSARNTTIITTFLCLCSSLGTPNSNNGFPFDQSSQYRPIFAHLIQYFLQRHTTTGREAKENPEKKVKKEEKDKSHVSRNGLLSRLFPFVAQAARPVLAAPPRCRTGRSQGSDILALCTRCYAPLLSVLLFYWWMSIFFTSP